MASLHSSEQPRRVGPCSIALRGSGSGNTEGWEAGWWASSTPFGCSVPMVSWGSKVGEYEMPIARVPPTAIQRGFRVVRGGHEFLDYQYTHVRKSVITKMVRINVRSDMSAGRWGKGVEQ